VSHLQQKDLFIFWGHYKRSKVI